MGGRGAVFEVNPKEPELHRTAARTRWQGVAISGTSLLYRGFLFYFFALFYSIREANCLFQVRKRYVNLAEPGNTE